MTRAPDRVLIVDDEARIRKIVTLLLREEGLDPRSVESGEACLKAVAEESPDLVLMDLTLPGRDGLETMAGLRAGGWDGEVVMMTAFGSVATAVRAIQEGAFHYLEKPFDNDELLSLVRRALERRRLRGEVAALREQLDERYALDNVVGISGPLRAVCAQVTRVAPTEATVPGGGGERHRQGAGGARPAQPQPAPGGSLRRPELRRPAREPGGERALRPREGSLYRANCNTRKGRKRESWHGVCTDPPAPNGKPGGAGGCLGRAAQAVSNSCMTES